MISRLTPEESNQVRCDPRIVQGDCLNVDDIKNDLDTFMIYRSSFDRARMIYLAARIMQRVNDFLTPFLSDIGMSMYQETLSDEEYTTLLEQSQVDSQLQGDDDGDDETQNDS